MERMERLALEAELEQAVLVEKEPTEGLGDHQSANFVEVGLQAFGLIITQVPF